MTEININVADVSEGDESAVRSKLLEKAINYIGDSKASFNVEILIGKRTPLDDPSYILPGSIECGITISKIDNGKVVRQIYIHAIQGSVTEELKFHS